MFQIALSDLLLKNAAEVEVNITILLNASVSNRVRSNRSLWDVTYLFYTAASKIAFTANLAEEWNYCHVRNGLYLQVDIYLDDYLRQSMPSSLPDSKSTAPTALPTPLQHACWPLVMLMVEQTPGADPWPLLVGMAVTVKAAARMGRTMMNFILANVVGWVIEEIQRTRVIGYD